MLKVKETPELQGLPLVFLTYMKSIWGSLDNHTHKYLCAQAHKTANPAA